MESDLSDCLLLLRTVPISVSKNLRDRQYSSPSATSSLLSVQTIKPRAPTALEPLVALSNVWGRGEDDES